MISVESRVRNFRGRHGSWKLVHHHRVGTVATAAAWVGLWAAFGKPSMEVILRCRFPRTLNIIWYTRYKLNI